MLYEPLAQLIEQKKELVARRTAGIVQERGLRLFAGVAPEKVAPLLLQPIEMIIRYLRTGEAREWQTYVSQLSNGWRKRGYTADEVNAVGGAITETIVDMIQQEWPGPANATQRERYLRRMSGLNSLAGVSSIVAHVKKED